jgi:hypothetical protein
MRDPGSIDQKFGNIYGAGRGNDAVANALRVGKPESFVEAIDRASSLLRKRVAGLTDDDETKIWVEDSIEAVENLKETLREQKDGDNQKIFVLWDVSASVLHLAHIHLQSKGL